MDREKLQATPLIINCGQQQFVGFVFGKGSQLFKKQTPYLKLMMMISSLLYMLCVRI